MQLRAAWQPGSRATSHSRRDVAPAELAQRPRPVAAPDRAGSRRTRRHAARPALAVTLGSTSTTASDSSAPHGPFERLRGAERVVGGGGARLGLAAEAGAAVEQRPSARAHSASRWRQRRLGPARVHGAPRSSATGSETSSRSQVDERRRGEQLRVERAPDRRPRASGSVDRRSRRRPPPAAAPAPRRRPAPRTPTAAAAPAAPRRRRGRACGGRPSAVSSNGSSASESPVSSSSRNACAVLPRLLGQRGRQQRRAPRRGPRRGASQQRRTRSSSRRRSSRRLVVTGSTYAQRGSRVGEPAPERPGRVAHGGLPLRPPCGVVEQRRNELRRRPHARAPPPAPATRRPARAPRGSSVAAARRPRPSTAAADRRSAGSTAPRRPGPRAGPPRDRPRRRGRRAAGPPRSARPARPRDPRARRPRRAAGRSRSTPRRRARPSSSATNPSQANVSLPAPHPAPCRCDEPSV